MTRLAIFPIAGVFASGLSSAALAHPGHLAAVAGHDHWDLLGGLAILALAVVIAVRAVRRGGAG
jgi:hypothetical protein